MTYRYFEENRNEPMFLKNKTLYLYLFSKRGIIIFGFEFAPYENERFI